MTAKCKYEYLSADKFIRVNEDPGLIPIKIYLPKLPRFDLIDGYGKPPDEQMFERQRIPIKLLEIEKKCDYDINRIWNYIELHAAELKNEIYFIKY